MYGAAIGDALGLATVNMTQDECKFYYDKTSLNYSDIVTDKQRLHWEQGDWTTAFDQMVGHHKGLVRDFMWKNAESPLLS